MSLQPQGKQKPPCEALAHILLVARSPCVVGGSVSLLPTAPGLLKTIQFLVTVTSAPTNDSADTPC